MSKPRQRAAVGGWLGVCVASIVCTLPVSAAANGKFPEAGQLVVHPSDASRMALVTTFGVLATSDGGAAWDVICEAGAGYADIEPAIAVGASGRLSLGLFAGVATSTADGCDWGLASGPSDFVPDVTTSPSGATIVAALSFDSVAAQGRYWTSTDEGLTFTASSGALDPGLTPLTVDIATADGSRVYVSGVRGDPAQGVLARSFDGGATWEELHITGSGAASWPYIGALDPSDPDVLYVRLFSDPGRLLRSTDAGSSWENVYEAPGFVRALAVSPDGAQVVVGNEDGISRANVDTMAFEQVSSTAVFCLTWRDDGLFACGHKLFNDGFAVARSTDAGATFEPLVSFECVRGLLSCDGTSTVGSECPAEWPMLSNQLETDTCGVVTMPTSSATTSTTVGTGAGTDGQPPPEASSGCDCHTASHPDGDALALASLLSLLLASQWRRRR